MGHRKLGKDDEVRGIHLSSDSERRASPWVWQRTVEGKRVRTFFSTREEAIRMMRAAERANREGGADLRRVFDGKSQREYEAAMKVLGGRCGLVEACLFWCGHSEGGARKEVLVRDGVKMFLEQLSRRGATENYYSSMRLYLEKFCGEFGGRSCESVKGKEILGWVERQRLSAQSKRVVLTKISGFFKRLVGMEVLGREPRIDWGALPKVLPREVSRLSVEETWELLEFIGKKHRRYLANFALRCFCGLRREEAAKMRWEWIDEGNRRIVLPAGISKTRQNFALQSPILPGTVFEWLSAVPAEEKEGLVASPHKDFYRVLDRELSFGWKKNVLRHTFCTMHISAYGDASKTALLLRHRNASMLYRHYLAALATEEEALRYFSLKPRGKWAGDL